jgi:hypothetical protein
MKFIIYLLLFSIIIFVSLKITITETFNDKKHVSEGKLSYSRRMFTKHIHRPSKLKLREVGKKINQHYTKFKRNYL